MTFRMKAVRPFFARAAKKCKYSYEGEVHQTSAGKQFGRKSTEINDAMEAMSSASLVDMQGLRASFRKYFYITRYL